MNAVYFQKRLDRITEQAAKDIAALMEVARTELKDDQPVEFADDPNVERAIDALAELSGWTYDRLNGINRLHRKSMTRKIKKALGYNK